MLEKLATNKNRRIATNSITPMYCIAFMTISVKPNATLHLHRGAVQRSACPTRTALPGVRCKRLLGPTLRHGPALSSHAREPRANDVVLGLRVSVGQASLGSRAWSVAVVGVCLMPTGPHNPAQPLGPLSRLITASRFPATREARASALVGSASTRLFHRARGPYSAKACRYRRAKSGGVGSGLIMSSRLQNTPVILPTSPTR
jgi:hypothetical protein